MSYQSFVQFVCCVGFGRRGRADHSRGDRHFRSRVQRIRPLGLLPAASGFCHPV